MANLINILYLNNLNMFMFKWCCQQASNHKGGDQKGYKVSWSEEIEGKPIFRTKFHTSIEEVQQTYPIDQVSVIQYTKSDYEKLLEKHSNPESPWEDIRFPGEEQANNYQWRSITQFIKKPSLFNQVSPFSAFSEEKLAQVNECEIALAVLSEKKQRIKDLFCGQGYLTQRIYQLPLLINGNIEEIIFDDCIPVTETEKPIFGEIFHESIWGPLMLKGLAKGLNGFHNLENLKLEQTFRMLTYTSIEVIRTNTYSKDKMALWAKLEQILDSDFPCCCLTSSESELSESAINHKLSPNQFYTLLGVKTLEDKDKKQFRLVKLRTLCGADWDGQASEKDTAFWNKIVNTPQTGQFLKPHRISKGIIFMPFYFFCQSFNSIHFCGLQENSKFFNAQLNCSGKKNGNLYTFRTFKKGLYTIRLHQKDVHERGSDGLHRATLLLIEETGKEAQPYGFIDGIMKYLEVDTNLRLYLQPGNYLIYAKLDPSIQHQIAPQIASVSVFSSNLVILNVTEKDKHPSLLEKTFLDHSRKSEKKMLWNQGLMSISFKIFYQRGGYAYIVFTNAPESQEKFVISFDESDFNREHFVLKKPFKGKGKQDVQIRPGQETIILARVSKTSLTKSVTFPPPQLNINTQPI